MFVSKVMATCRRRWPTRFCVVTLGRKLPYGKLLSHRATQNALKSRSLICVKCPRRLSTPRPTPRFLHILLFLRLHFCLPLFVRRVRWPRCIIRSRTLKLNSLASMGGTTHLRFLVARLFILSRAISQSDTRIFNSSIPLL